MNTALVVGATGFIGRHLVNALYEAGGAVKVLSRRNVAKYHGHTVSGGRIIPVVADLSDHTSINQVCDGVDTVFHLAGYAHAEESSGESAAAIHRSVTVEGTRALLEEARHAGVRRFVFTSSVKAMGEGGKECLSEAAPALPATAYGQAKLEAERLVLASHGCGMHVCVLRLPLVYGPGVKGNLLQMIEAIHNGRFPPVPEVKNRRSMVHVNDVVQALRLATELPRANGEVYLVTDGQTYSTREMYVLISLALGKVLPKWNVPIGALRLVATMGDIIGWTRRRPFFFNNKVLNKLLGSACYNSEKIECELGFKPTQTFEAALPAMVEEYRTRGGRT